MWEYKWLWPNFCVSEMADVQHPNSKSRDLISKHALRELAFQDSSVASANVGGVRQVEPS